LISLTLTGGVVRWYDLVQEDFCKEVAKKTALFQQKPRRSNSAQQGTTGKAGSAGFAWIKPKSDERETTTTAPSWDITGP
jgi:hypothetical protein